MVSCKLLKSHCQTSQKQAGCVPEWKKKTCRKWLDIFLVLHKRSSETRGISSAKVLEIMCNNPSSSNYLQTKCVCVVSTHTHQPLLLCYPVAGSHLPGRSESSSLVMDYSVTCDHCMHGATSAPTHDAAATARKFTFSLTAFRHEWP